VVILPFEIGVGVDLDQGAADGGDPSGVRRRVDEGLIRDLLECAIIEVEPGGYPLSLLLAWSVSEALAGPLCYLMCLL
jgi:hypothetical protein